MEAARGGENEGRGGALRKARARREEQKESEGKRARSEENSRRGRKRDEARRGNYFCDIDPSATRQPAELAHRASLAQSRKLVSSRLFSLPPSLPPSYLSLLSLPLIRSLFLYLYTPGLASRVSRAPPHINPLPVLASFFSSSFCFASSIISRLLLVPCVFSKS